jgi:SAM-dependent methyltransferase
LFAVLMNVLSAREVSAQQPTADTGATQREISVRPGINRDFLNPDLNVEQWVARFELESREIFAARQDVLAACQLRRGLRVADVGAGTGLYSRLFAEAVGNTGWVYAVDIAPAFVQHITQRAAADRLANLTAVLCTERSITLPPASIDLAFVCDTYHHFEYPRATLESIHRALAADGRLIVIDFERIPGQSREWVLEHVRAGKTEFRSEIEAAGFTFVDEVKIDGFRENYLLRFKR